TGSVGSGGAAGGATTVQTTGGEGGSPHFGGGGAGGGACVSCSPDLHSVLDCNGKVLMACPTGLGCGPGGQCIAPCDAAKANQSTIGCDFYAAVVAPNIWVMDGCFAAFIG